MKGIVDAAVGRHCLIFGLRDVAPHLNIPAFGGAMSIDNNDFRLLVSLIGLVLLFLVVLLSLYLVIKVFRYAIRWLRWSAGKSGDDAVLALICFSVAAYIYPNPILYLVQSGWEFIRSLLSYLPLQLQQQLLFLQGCKDPSCLNVAVLNLTSSWITYFTNALSQLAVNKFPFIDAIMFTAVWIGLANLFGARSLMTPVLHWLGEQFRDAARSAASFSRALKLNLLLVFVLLLSGYLCLTSIIAIPTLQESPDDKIVTSAELHNQLQAGALKDTDFDQRFPLELNAITFPDLSGFDDKIAPAIRSVNTDVKRRFGSLQQNWIELREGFRRDQAAVIDISTQTYEFENKGRKGARETQQHQLNIELWFHRWSTDRASQLTQCKSDIERFVASATSQLELVTTLARTPIGGNSAFSATPDFFSELSRRVTQSEADAHTSCAGKPDTWDIPTRADFGGYLGVFGLAARWLLKTESLPLVLITGLLGFGLLGAGCSSVIRNVSRRSDGEPLVPDLASVVIRGTSAATLVFLAVFGGLAVFANGNATPNPYVVLFTCFVAAVFSEDAWSWGRDKFRSQFGDAEGAQRGTGQEPQKEVEAGHG